MHTDYVQGGKAQQVCVSLVLFKTFVALQFIIALVTGVAVRVILALLVLVLFHVGLVLVLCLVLLIPIFLLLFFCYSFFP